jgi:hypothetical protein
MGLLQETTWGEALPKISPWCQFDMKESGNFSKKTIRFADEPPRLRGSADAPTLDNGGFAYSRYQRTKGVKECGGHGADNTGRGGG